ncbi:transcription factor MYB20-like [Punica granatum]|uniref:Transcription factor MYB20-like n=1 Tax=Punica granatum TaxID=22663 RepID=A0A218XXC4_PUNGR|nr:transcription factor MYB20-like [Punica granatum]OWM89717.1 hypothetical protein CDL15_Pgr024465 [Punica granatum]
MGRQPCCEKVGLRRGPWTIEEDQKLVDFILKNGIQCWRVVPTLAGLLRCGKSCRLRWINYLRPDLKRGVLTEAEEDQIIELHSRLGNRWSKIAAHLPGRTDNEIKNHWNTRIKKRLKLLGLDPQTHEPIIHDERPSRKENAWNADISVKDQQPIPGKEVCRTLKTGANPDPKDTCCSKSLTLKMDESMTQENCFPNLIETAESTFSWDSLSELEQIFQYRSHR